MKVYLHAAWRKPAKQLLKMVLVSPIFHRSLAIRSYQRSELEYGSNANFDINPKVIREICFLDRYKVLERAA